MTKDKVNASWEYCGVFWAIENCRALIDDRGQIQGVSEASILFFFFWGIWNLWYYRSLDQNASAIASIGLVGANGLWIVLALYYRFFLLT